MSIAFAAFIGSIIVFTAFLTGIFGMAGGLLLMGILLMLMPVPSAMIVHGVTQASSNGSRVIMMWRYVSLRVAAGFAAGSAVSTLVLALILFVPDKGVILLLMGALPFLSLSVPPHLVPRIDRRGGGIACGVPCMFLGLTTGVAGPLLDLFFVRTDLDRREVVATKAACNTIIHVTKTIYFGTLIGTGADTVPVTLLAMALVLPFVGNWLARPVLDWMSNDQFRYLTRRIILVIGTVYLIQGAYYYLG